MIPKIIHYCWFGKNKKSDLIEKCIESWRKYLPDFEIREWNEDNFDIENSCDFVKQAYESKMWAFVSDYVRLNALYNFGGIYLDTDVEILKGFGDLLEFDSFLGAESHYTVSTAMLAASPHTKWVEDFMEEYNNTSFINEDNSYNTTPNSKRLQKYLEEKYNYHWSDKPQELESNFIIFPAEYFSPINCYTGVFKKTENTRAIHHFDATWKSKGAKFKNKLLMLITRIIGEDRREKLVNSLKRKKK